jgi:hypothetical protein
MKGGSIMIGLSLSICVQQICQGKVDLAKVEKIVSSIRCADDQSFDRVILEYKQSYWKEFSEEAEKIARQLKADGKIEQPRLKNDNHFPDIRKTGCWVKSKRNIIWRKGF